MTEIQIRDDFTVDLVDQMGSDESILEAMLVSTLTDDTVDEMSTKGKTGRINFLMSNRHGSPFEHNSMVFRVEAPIFVYREWHRHRIGISINEQSGRYTKFKPIFYVPPKERNLVQVGKPGAYEFIPADDDVYYELVDDMLEDYQAQWDRYERRLDKNIAKEVARMTLGVGIYSTMYWTCNARSLMAFLSLRTKKDYAVFPSFPMWEIMTCADATEQVFKELFPLTWAAFDDNGRICP